MRQSNHFDYIIIGNGLAGLQLALKLASDSFFSDKQIALIDFSEKNNNDKTWSFWETGSSYWDAIVHKTWQHAFIKTSKKSIALDLEPYIYKSIRSIDFYNHAKRKLSLFSNIHFVLENVEDVQEAHNVILKTDKNTYSATHVFDSRIPKEFKETASKYVSIIQHFKGWIIKTDTPVFDANAIVMMDYRLKDDEQTTFTYVLPFSENEALVEFTYFNDHIVDETVYDHYIKTYIDTFLKIENYSIVETETGIIPMTNFPFENFSTKKITKIGTGGGWVKGSTGYSFKHTDKKTSIIIDNLKTNKNPSHGLLKKKYRFYDKVFLKVLKDENHKGEWIFESFYDKNSVQTMFRFLDEESSFSQEIKIMLSLFSWSFIKAFFKTL